MKPKTIITLFAGIISSSASATEFMTGFDLQGKISRQQYTDGSTSTTSRLALQPWITRGDWMFYAELPFEGRESQHQSTQQVYVTGKNGRIIRRIPAQTLLTTRQQNTDGIADASIGVSYSFAGLNTQWQHSFAMDYKFDNGDTSDALGSGTRETAISTSTRYQIAFISMMAQLGYTIVEAPSQIDVLNFAYGSVGATWKIHQHLKSSLSYNNQTKPYSTAPDQASVQLNAEWKAMDILKLSIAYNDYLSSSISLPQNDVSVSATLLF